MYKCQWFAVFPNPKSHSPNMPYLPLIKSTCFLFPPQPCAWGVDLWSLLTPSPPCAPWQRLKPDSPVSIRWRVSRRWCRSPGTRSFQMAAKIWSSQLTSWTAIEVLDWRSSCKVPGENKNFSNNILAKLFSFLFLGGVMSEVQVKHCFPSRCCSCGSPWTWYLVQAFIIKTKTTIWCILWFQIHLHTLPSSGYCLWIWTSVIKCYICFITALS